MANPEHLEILNQGVEVWNEWRGRHKELFVTDLSGADLSGADLSGGHFGFADLSGANLRRTDLSRANLRRSGLVRARLSRADLTNADLKYADLRFADLRFADLSRAHLNSAYLTGADLSGADLIFADFSRAHLSGADFNTAKVGESSFGANDLSQTKGLETVVHFQASVIGIETLYKSRGNIPEIFLRGCGVPEDFIIYMRSLTVHPLQFYKSFISYSSKDQMFADRLYTDLQSKGVRCWLASENLKIGAKIRTGIDEAIQLHDKLMLVLSRHSVTSDWVEQEVETALERERKEKRPVLFPIRLDDAVMKVKGGWPALIRNTRNIGDFRKWKNHDSYQKAFDRLLRDLKSEA